MSPHPTGRRLTDHRLQCLARLVASGRPTNECALLLGVSEATVRDYTDAWRRYREAPVESWDASPASLEPPPAGRGQPYDLEVVDEGPITGGSESTTPSFSPQQLRFIHYVEAFTEKLLSVEVLHRWRLTDLLDKAYAAVKRALDDGDIKVSKDTAFQLFEQLIPRPTGPTTQVNAVLGFQSNQLQVAVVDAFKGLAGVAQQLQSLGPDTFTNHLREVGVDTGQTLLETGTEESHTSTDRTVAQPSPKPNGGGNAEATRG